MRVLHLGAGNLYGGVERLLVTLARERHHCPEMEPQFGLCFEGRLSEELRAADVPLHMLGEARFSRPWTVWRSRHALRSLMKVQSFDAVVCHSCWPHALFGATAQAAGLPISFWTHDFPKGTHWLDRRAARTSPDLVLANSRCTLAEVPKLFPKARRVVLYYPVSPPDSFNAENERERVRSEMRVAPEEVVIITACRLEPWKGHALLLSALGHLREVPGWKCWIVGGAQRPHEHVYLNDLHSIARHEGIADRILFLGQRSDVPRLLAGADIHCQPNTGPEPFGIAFVEGLYAGLPVVTTAIGAAQEIVTPNCGRLAPPGDTVTLAAELKRLRRSSSLRGELGAAGRCRAHELCDPARRVKEVRHLISSTIKPKVAA